MLKLSTVGKPRSITLEQEKEIYELYHTLNDEGKRMYTVSSIAEHTGVAIGSLYDVLKRYNPEDTEK